MYDTRPDLESFLLGARRLWWLPVAVALLFAVIFRPAPAEVSSNGVGVVHVPAPSSFLPASTGVLLYDPQDVADTLADDLGAFGADGRLESVVRRPGAATIDIQFPEATDGSTEETLAKVDELLAASWARVMEPSLAPARALAASRAEAVTRQLEQLPADTSGSLSFERANLIETQINDRALLDAFDATVDSAPQVTQLRSGTTSAEPTQAIVPIALRVAAGLFIGGGAVIVICMLDHRLRRRSIVERNGLTVVAIQRLGDTNLVAVPAAILSASSEPVSNAVVVGVTDTAGLAPVLAALDADAGIGAVAQLETPAVADGGRFVAMARDADALILVATAGKTTYEQLLEASRTALASGAHNVCAVIVTRSARSAAEAMS